MRNIDSETLFKTKKQSIFGKMKTYIVEIQNFRLAKMSPPKKIDKFFTDFFYDFFTIVFQALKFFAQASKFFYYEDHDISKFGLK